MLLTKTAIQQRRNLLQNIMTELKVAMVMHMKHAKKTRSMKSCYSFTVILAPLQFV